MKKLLIKFLTISIISVFVFNLANSAYASELNMDMMEYSSDANAQAAYVTNATFASQYPPAQNGTYVKSTTNDGQFPYQATDPTKSLVGNAAGNSWSTPYNYPPNQRFHIDLGSAKIIKKIYYENYHHNGGYTGLGAKNFTFWGSNNGTAFSTLTYGTDTNWTQLTTSQSTFNQHVHATNDAENPTYNVPDPKYITVTNTTAYRYYAFKFPDCQQDSCSYLRIRRIELQTSPSLTAYTTSVTKTQGSYALKGIASATGSLNKTFTHTIGTPLDLTDQTTVSFDLNASRTGSNIKISIHDSGGTTTDITPNITSAGVFQTISWDLSAVTNANKDAIDSMVITIVNATADNTFYLDNMKASFSATVTSTGISLPAGGTLKDGLGNDLTNSGTATDNVLYAYDSEGKKIASFGITGTITGFSGLIIDKVPGRAWIDGLNAISNIGTKETRELYVPFSQDTKADTVWICEYYNGVGSTIRESNCTTREGTLSQWNTDTEVGTTKNGVTLFAVNTTDKDYEFKGLTASGGGEGGAGEEEEAIPEFTLITAIIACVAGFGIYFVIRQRNSRKKIATNK